METSCARTVKMTRRYGNVGISYREFSIASGVSESTIMDCVRILEPFVEKMEKDE